MNETVIAALIGAGSGAAVSALISAFSNGLSNRRSTREEARRALWEYQRAVAGVASKLLTDAGYGDDVYIFNQADLSDVREAHRAAFPWASYLSPYGRSALIREAHFNIGEPPYGREADEASGLSAQRLALALEDELERVFPVTLRNAIRVRLRRRRAR